jgi:hypothetical protein
MTGSPAERNLLGAALADNRVLRHIEGLVDGRDFEDGRLGAIWDGIGAMVARGETAAPETVVLKFPEWDVRGVSEVEVWTWVGPDVLPHIADEYARAVRDGAYRRSLRIMSRKLAEQAGDSGVNPASAAADASQELATLVDGTSTRDLVTKSLAEILAEEDSYDWVIPGLLERRDRLILTGFEGAGKTTLMRQFAVLAAAGIHPFLNRPIEPCRVLVVDAENTETQWRRQSRKLVAQAMSRVHRNPAETIRIVAGKRIDLTQGTHLAEIHRLVDDHQPDILFIGPLYKLVPRAINSDDDAAPLIVALDGLRERGVALVMEAHAGKGGSALEGRDLRPRGSAALLGWPEFGYGLAPSLSDPDFMVQMVAWRGDREERGWPRHLRRAAGPGDWPWTPADVRD